MPELEDNDKQEVKEVKDHTVIKGQDYYLVKWTGWPAEYNLQILANDIKNAKEAIQRYSKAKKAKEVATAKQNKRQLLLLFFLQGFNKDSQDCLVI